ncbi:MAG TPA: hypothetical protein PLG43_12650, partial [Spirochaetia bacterium]|nr:hypothetical protein [Spirochaetia bacterium]
AVCLCKGKGDTYRQLSGLSIKGFHVEAGGDDEYGTVVVRQKTGGTGYRTTVSDCKKLFKVVLGILSKV